VIEIFEEGEGDEAKDGWEVAVHYTGWLVNGFEFDSSFKREKPIDLELGTGRVIKGWEMGLIGIKKGGKRRLTIPAELGYQDRGKGPIPPDSTLVFIVEAVELRAPLPDPKGDDTYTGEPKTKKEIKGVQILTFTEGSGEGAKAGDLVSLHYTGRLDDGTVFDSSITRKAPFKFQLGKGQVIAGWDIGIEGMKVGETRKLVIPADKGYGERASGKIPPNSNLTFQVEMMRIAPGPTK
jgi:peptidylprolyl isomerase